MSWNIVRLADVPVSPWKNGGGTTRELAAWPAGGEWLWRMSVAEVERDGPFSSFPGVERWFAVLEGQGVVLGPHHRLDRNSPPFSFDGAHPIDCTLIAGPTRDFNLMLRSPSACGEMLRVRSELEIDLSATEFIAIFSSGERCSGTFGTENVHIEHDTLAWRRCDAPTRLRIEADDALCMRIRA